MTEKKQKFKVEAEIVNGKISYLPVMTSPGKDAKLFVKEWLE